MNYELISIPSWGDKHKEISLLEGDAPANFFTRELDEMLSAGEADIAIHSAKDLPHPLPEGLELIALTPAQDQRDALVSKDNLPLAALPSGARIGTSSAMRQKELLAIRHDIEIVGIRGTIEERIAQMDSGKADAVIIALCALRRLGLEHRATEVLGFETNALQGHLAVVARQGRDDLKAQFAPADVRRRWGKVVLAGFGTGNPDLLTFATHKALLAADVIFYDDLTNENYIKQTYERMENGEWKMENCLTDNGHSQFSILNSQLIYVGKRCGQHSHSQEEINRLLLHAAKEGKQVVRLKGGDPMVFGRAGEEIEYLERNLVQVSVIPGISAAMAAAAECRQSLTRRGKSSSVALVSGYGEDVLVPGADTLVYYMGGAHIREIALQLVAQGRSADAPATLVYNASLPDCRVLRSTLGELGAGGVAFPTPVVMMVYC